MGATSLPYPRARVSSTIVMLQSMAADVDGYWSRHELSRLFNECQMSLCEEERSAFGLILRGLHRLYPFDHDRDYPTNIKPRHAI